MSLRFLEVPCIPMVYFDEFFNKFSFDEFFDEFSFDEFFDNYF